MTHDFQLLNSETLFGSVEVEHWRHQKNNLEVVLSPRGGCGTVAIQTWYRVGSAHENPQMTGLAHFFEHMMFRGTEKCGVGEFDRILEELGVNGGTNAFTWKDFTAYVQEVPVEALEKVFELEADRMVNLNLTDQNIHEELGAVVDEKQRSLSDYDSIRFDEFFEKAFPGQSSAWPVLGYEDHIQKYNEEILTSYYKRFYKPNNALIVLCGDVSRSSLDLIEKFFGMIPEGELSTCPSRTLIQGNHRVNQPISLSRLELSFPLKVGDEDLWVWGFIGRLLSGNDTCLFEREFVSKNEILSSNFWVCQAGEGDHFFQLGIAISKNQDPQKIKKKILSFFEKPEAWLTEEFLNIVRVEADCDFYYQMSRLEDRASALGEMWAYTKSFSGFAQRESILNSLNVSKLREKIKQLTGFPCFELQADPQ